MLSVGILVVLLSEPITILKRGGIAHAYNRILIIAGMAKIELNQWCRVLWFGFPNQRVGKAVVVDAVFFCCSINQPKKGDSLSWKPHTSTHTSPSGF